MSRSSKRKAPPPGPECPEPSGASPGSAGPGAGPGPTAAYPWSSLTRQHRGQHRWDLVSLKPGRPGPTRLPAWTGRRPRGPAPCSARTRSRAPEPAAREPQSLPRERQVPSELGRDERQMSLAPREGHVGATEVETGERKLARAITEAGAPSRAGGASPRPRAGGRCPRSKVIRQDSSPVGAGSGLCALQAFDGLNEAHPPCEGPRLHSASPPRQSHPETPSQTHPEERLSPCPAPCSHGPVRLTHATDTHAEAHSRGWLPRGFTEALAAGVSLRFRKETQDTAELRAGDGGLVPPKLERQRWFRALREDCHQEGPPGRAGNMSAPAPGPHTLGPFWAATAGLPGEGACG